MTEFEKIVKEVETMLGLAEAINDLDIILNAEDPNKCKLPCGKFVIEETNGIEKRMKFLVTKQQAELIRNQIKKEIEELR